MTLINFIIIIFGLAFSKELIAANEERIIVSSLVIVLILGLEFLGDTAKEELNTSVSSIYEEMRSYIAIYYGIIKAFERLTIQRNVFLTTFFVAIGVSISNLKDLLNEWSVFSARLMRLVEYTLLKYQVQL